MTADYDLASDSRRLGSRWERAKRVLVPVITLGIFLLALFAIHRLLIDLSYERLLAELKAVKGANLSLAAIAAFGAYVAMTGYDWFALRYISRTLPYRTVALASFCGYAIANTVGFSLVTGGSVRYRLYAAAGLDGMDVVRITLFCALGFGFGVHVVGAAALAFHPEILADMLHMPAAWLRWAGIAVIAVILLPVLGTFIRHTPIGWGKWKFLPPSGPVSLGVLGISVLDVCFTGICLYVFLPPGVVPFVGFMVIFSVAVFAAVSSHVPGGLGVFESVMLIALGGAVQAETLTAALILYRAMYYLIPLILATALMALRELAVTAAPIWASAIKFSPMNARVVPPMMAGLTFGGGLLLLISAATPVTIGRIEQLRMAFPLALVESAHVFSAIVGFLLLIISRGLYRRLRSGYQLAMLALLGGGVLSIVKGNDYEVAFALLAMALLLTTSRREFYRTASLRNSPYTRTWIATVAGVVIAMSFVTAFSYKDTPYASHLWLLFDYSAQLSRAMRAQLGVLLAAGLLSLMHLRTTRQRVQAIAVKQELSSLKRIIASQGRTDAYLALLGDKQILFSDNSDAFLMYAMRGSHWIALGDPFGSTIAEEELVWRFRELAEQEGASIAFYHTRPDTFSLYVDMGLSPLKIGEEAIVDLSQFRLDSPEATLNETIRQSWSRSGLHFDVLPAGGLFSVWSELLLVEDAWLAAENTREKSFSLGAFSAAYLENFPLAVVRADGRIVALAALTITETRMAASLDVIRHLANVPPYVMEFLFARAMHYCQGLGTKQFLLGLTPPAEIESHPLAPLWQQHGDLIYNRGERFTNFQALRDFKQQFHPHWEARYFAVSGGISTVAFVNDVAQLIGGQRSQ